MTALPIDRSNRNLIWQAGISALLLLALTAVHHIYGAVAFSTPWRLHILHIAVPNAVVIVAALFFGSRHAQKPNGRIALWVGAIAILAFPVLAMGMFEGGYNHVLKNIVYFGLGEPAARTLFPPPAYEMPKDLFFELSGIAQFPLSIVTAWRTFAMLRENWRR